MYAGEKVYFWHNDKWNHGRLALGAANITPDGLFFRVITDDNTYVANIPFDNIKEDYDEE